MTSNAAVANFSADEALRRRLEDFRFDAPGALFPFSSRLAKQEGWSAGFAARAIAEYRRFLYLACVSGREMTPAPAVDAVWHLHLIYTRSYWDELCGAVLRRPLHHNPTNGGRTEDSRFQTAYAATLACYETAFGTAPPADIWPPASVPSSARSPRAKSPILRAIATLAVIATPQPALAQGANIELFKRYGGWIAASVALVFVIGRQIRRSLHTPKDQRKSGSDGGGGCSSSDSGSQGASSDSGGGSSDSGGSSCGSSCGGGGGD